MTAAVPKLLPMEDILIKREAMWKRGLRFILKMTSGAVYSIVMHILLITAYALLIFRIFYTSGFDLGRFIDVTAGPFFFYLMYGLMEIALRQYLVDDRMCVTMFGHLSHLIGCIFLRVYMVPLNPIEAFAFCFLRTPLLLWCFFVLFSICIPEFLEDDSLEPLLV